MDNREKILKAAEIESPLKRQMAIASIISTELEKYGTKAVVVGGSAVEFYTTGHYLTRDIDFITPDPDNIRTVMNELGFKNDGGIWYIPDTAIVVEFPAGPLDGSWDKVSDIVLDDGSLVKMIGIEDIIIDRACAAANWSERADERIWICTMMNNWYEEIDWGYLEKQAKYQLCSDVVKTCKDWTERERAELHNEQLLSDKKGSSRPTVTIVDVELTVRNGIREIDSLLQQETDPEQQKQFSADFKEFQTLKSELDLIKDKSLLVHIDGRLTARNLIKQVKEIQQQVKQLRIQQK